MTTSPARQAYRELTDEVYALYDQNRVSAALALLDESAPLLEPWQAELAYLRACLYGHEGRPHDALHSFLEGLASGGWWDPAVLEGDDDLHAIRTLAGYDHLLRTSRARWLEGNAGTDTSGNVLCEARGTARGLVVALHGAEEDAADAVAAWEPVTAGGHALLAIRSSRRTSPNYRTWSDPRQAIADIEAALAGLPTRLVGLPRVAVGFSAGGRTALTWALTANPSPVNGVVAVAPAIGADSLPASGPDLTPAHLIVGEHDDLRPQVLACGDALAGAGFSCAVVPGLGHAVPPAAAMMLETASLWGKPAGSMRRDPLR